MAAATTSKCSGRQRLVSAYGVTTRTCISIAKVGDSAPYESSVTPTLHVSNRSSLRGVKVRFFATVRGSGGRVATGRQTFFRYHQAQYAIGQHASRRFVLTLTEFPFPKTWVQVQYFLYVNGKFITQIKTQSSPTVAVPYTQK
jgi:hypothetical protein